MEALDREHEARSVMVTSAGASQGKSTTIANLAVALARNGVRVILVDLDLRRPTLMSAACSTR
jgi:Mrp family chromosome partitioning ATPase